MSLYIKVQVLASDLLVILSKSLNIPEHQTSPLKDGITVTNPTPKSDKSKCTSHLAWYLEDNFTKYWSRKQKNK